MKSIFFGIVISKSHSLIIGSVSLRIRVMVSALVCNVQSLMFKFRSIPLVLVHPQCVMMNGIIVWLLYMYSRVMSILSYSRIQGEDSLIKMTRAAYSHFIHGYFENDRLLFSLLLALEVCRAILNLIELIQSSIECFVK